MLKVFAILITMQFLAVVLHDWVDIPGCAHGRQVQAVIGRTKLGIASLINAIFPALAVAFAWQSWTLPHPTQGKSLYWMIYCAATLSSAIAMWWIPYFRGASEKTKRDYQRMYEGTLQVLPARGDNPRPNLLHLCFHGLFVATFALSLAIFAGA